ncbi:MAG: histidine phosphatase family protein [Hyphomonas sp.]|uniref:histidine phosphatase family protein n=1 Tax=Hyphomonas sp. TaxID=87 RepID=UPI0017AF1451|nr:histidine phosphatase family protein [Hyphomonas sp.]MBA3069500.1 histidine phosphatase family protein [Hyphomonas sp.]MBU4063882.1 histidine phosphatase family protein [Alphaproteobacteria bacterium]MBU4164157.1 histidine phosphatase family protein [Alphaproteobacteria bacterium]MBU4569374.1 histidine phosphatase family protein [Alphaproteobacteria bacterium]
MARLFVVRHGNTFDAGDVVTRVGGRTDLPLSVSGAAQAAKLAAHFAGTPFAAALASPLERTRATARAILGARTDAPALLIRSFLREIDYGADENQPEEAVVARLGEAALKAWDEDGAVPPGWIVDPASIREGWAALLREIAALPGTANVLVVTSNGTARFLPDVVDAKPAGLDRKLKTGAWGEIEVAAGSARILGWNRRP